MAGGRTPTGRDAVAWAREGVERGAGEILLTSMDRDGTQDGYELELTRAISERRRGAGDRLRRRRRAARTWSRASRPAPTPPCAPRSSTTAATASPRSRRRSRRPGSRSAADAGAPADRAGRRARAGRGGRGAGRARGRRRGARRAAGAHAARARPGRRGRRGGRGPPRRPPGGRRARPCTSASARRPCAPTASSSTSRGRAARPTRARARCRTCSWARRWPRTSARRDFSVNAIAVALADGDVTEWQGARATSPPAGCASCTTGPSATTPRGCCGWSATRTGSGSRRTPAHGGAGRPRVAGHGQRRPQGRRAAAADGRARAAGAGRPRAGAAAGLRRPPHLPRDPLAALAAACTGVEDLARRLDDLGFTARDRKVVVAAARAAPRLRLEGASEADVWRALHALPPRPPRSSPRAKDPAPRPRGAGSTTCATAGWPSRGDDLVAAGLSGPAVGRGLEAAMVALLEGRAPDRDAQLAAALAH